MTATGSPFRYVGSYTHFLTQSIAACARSGWPETRRISSTVPCAVKVASSTTVPLTRALDASAGNTGGVILTTFGSFTIPPTRTGPAGAAAFGGGGGGGGGGGARAGGAVAFADRTPPR